MNSFKKISILLIVIAVATGGFYFFFNKEKTYGFLFPGANQSNQVVAASKNFLDASKTNFINKIKEAVNRSESLAEETLKTAKTGVFNFFKKSVSDSVDSVGNKFGAETAITEKEGAQESAQESAEKKLTVRYSVKTNKPAYFSVKGFSGDSEDIKYEIDWGDGGKESGNIRSDEVKIVSHSWKKEGDYIIKFKISSIEMENLEYPVTVLP